MTDTLPKLLWERAASTPSEPALREKTFGIWSTFTWSAYRDRVAELCLGFESLGLEKGDQPGSVVAPSKSSRSSTTLQL